MRDADRLPPYLVIDRSGGGGSFWLGVVVGFGAALLLAPRTGAETRGEFADAGRLLRGALGRRAAGPVRAVRGAVASGAGQAIAAVETGRGAARDAREDLLRRVEEAKALRRAGNRPGVTAPAPPAASLAVVSVATEGGAGDLAR